MKVSTLLRSRKNWTQRALARTATGKVVPPDSEDAVCWCLLGALRKCYGTCNPNYKEAWGKLRNAVNYLYPIGAFNDTSTHAQVLAACRKAGI